MKKTLILWVDDEIDLLRPHILFLQDKGYEVITVTNGMDAISQVRDKAFDLIFLDENMPGLSGLETLSRIKTLRPEVPVVMITKSEEENIMDQAIGSKIADYLIKPVNPNQILLTIKKYTQTRELVSQKTTRDYQAEFSNISLQINSAGNFSDWCEIYRKLVYWELELEASASAEMEEILLFQKNEANREFAKYIGQNYLGWFDEKNAGKPLLSPSVMRNTIFPLLEKGEKVIFIVIDNLRLDQWYVIYQLLKDYLVVVQDELYCSILPTATQFARNALFAGLMPLEIGQLVPDLWISEEEEESKNQFEEELLRRQMSRAGKNAKIFYEKVNNLKAGKKLLEDIPSLLRNDLIVLVYNFVDLLSHARTEMEVIRELAVDEPAYRSLTLSWFQHSHLFDFIKMIAAHPVTLVITTDHGSVRVANPVKVIGDKKTSVNLRYKQGRNLNYNPREVFEIRQPAKAHLPTAGVTASYIFATGYDFLVYPNNYNYFVNYYRNTFQHGGISMEEMLIPLITLQPK
ncbi:MAG TPA: bifunctional response regulator/alkaline phosphatase family protein [Bacteroidales bacterium]|nr:bifunctional response regulator/alkaline phosphatase family protein [Bacteroidales bacterium]